jgi:TPR repeat protein
MLLYLGAGLAGLASAGVAGGMLRAAADPATTTLQQARAEFDAGHLTDAAAAFRVLAAKGDPQAEYWYGYTLDHGLGTVADAKAAITQYDKALAGGVVAAGTNLGELYSSGNAIPPDYPKARNLFTDAARLGDARAARDLGLMLRDGIGGPADPVGAFAWLEVASLRGDTAAQAERNHLLLTLSPAQQAEASQQAAALQAAKSAPNTPASKT